MKEKFTTNLRKLMIIIVLLITFSISLTFYLKNYMDTESALISITNDGDSMGILNEGYVIEEDTGQNLEGYQYKKFEKDGKNYVVKKKSIHLYNILSTALFPTIFVLILSVYLVKREEKKISKRYLGPMAKMIGQLEDIMRGRLDNISKEDLEEFENNIRDIGGDPKNFIAAFTELTENQKFRREFSSNVTHELKSPLTSINGYAEMIASGMVEGEDVERFAEIILKEGTRLLNMINEIIQISKFDDGRVDNGGFEKLYLKDLLNEINVTMGGYSKARNVDVEITGDNVYVYGKKTMIEDAFRNLMANAFNYSKPEGGKLKIGVYIDKEKENAIIKFIDNGVGIDEEDQERIFERFYVVDESRGRNTGSGLGLSLVKNIILAHNGSIDVESKLGIGSTFTVTLPLNFEQEINENYRKLVD